MSANYTEANYENSVIELFRNDLDYEYIYGPDIERDFYNPLYEDVLLDSLYRLNSGLPADAIQDALFKLKNFENGELVQKNAAFMDYLQNGIPVRYFVDGEERSSIVYLVDYKNPDNNSFIVANQWTFIENSNKRPDVILFLNGLPVVLVELKSPSREETDASEAYRQLRNYMQEIPSMFIYNAICVMSDQLTSKAGTITSGEDRFMKWKTKDGKYEDTEFAKFDTFFEGMFQKERLLDIVKNFICFSNEGINSFKILAGYHQYYAVRKAIESTKHATVTDGKGGVFWHTQGSGKSLSMVFYAHLLQEALDSPTIVVITDRNDLDDQLYGQFAKCKEFLRQEPIHAESRENLKSLLVGRQANGIIFTTMQKFEESHEALSERNNIIVMADEAHRGQYGLAETVDAKTGKIKIGTARIIRNTLPNATYIGFTGTPIAETYQTFGDEIDRIREFDVLTGKILGEREHVAIFPASHFAASQETLNKAIREIENFPKEGINFKDITTLLQNGEALKFAIDEIIADLKDKDVDLIVGPEARGFLMGTPVAYGMGVGFVPVRKPGKLPWEVESLEYDLEYGSNILEIHKDAIKPGQKVAIVDDLLATGGTMEAAAELIEKLGGEVVSMQFLIELEDLDGREKLTKYNVNSLIKY